MQRYFLNESCFSENRITLEGEDAHHLVRVMRAQEGDRIICCDGRSREVLARITAVGKDKVEAEIEQSLGMDREPRIAIWIAQSLPKGDKLETVIQKGTEIGAAHFYPFVSERTIVELDAKKEAKRLERWRKIAKEAAEQAHRSRIPGIDSPLKWKELLLLSGKADLTLIAYEKESTRMLRTVITEERRLKPDLQSIMLMIGPEGGFTEREVEEAEAAGARCVSLGKRILRTETAGMAALACLLYEFEEMGGT